MSTPKRLIAVYLEVDGFPEGEAADEAFMVAFNDGGRSGCPREVIEGAVWDAIHEAKLGSDDIIPAVVRVFTPDEGLLL